MNEQDAENTTTDDRVAQLEAQLAEYKAREAEQAAARQRSEWLKQVSEKTGVPAEALRGDTLEEIQAHADILKPLVHPAPKLPNVPNPAQHPQDRNLPEKINIMADLRRADVGRYV